MTITRLRTGALGALAAGALVAAGCGSSNNSGSSSSSSAASKAGTPMTLKIGMSAALAGPFAPFDSAELNGMRYAEKKINAAGGYKGVKVQIVDEDNKGQAAATSTTTQDLLDKGVRAFVLTTADSSVASGQLIQKAGGVMTMGFNTPPVLTSEIGPSSFFVIYADNVQAAAQAEYACSQGYKTAYLLVDPESPYTSANTMGKYFKEAFANKCGGRVVGQDTFKIGATNFSSNVTKLQNANPKPDVIFTSMFVPDSGTFLKQLRGAGVKTPFLGTDGDDDPLLVKTAGSAADGVVFATHGFPSPGGKLAQFNADYKQVTGKAPETSTTEAAGRDQIYALADAAARAKSTDPAKIAEALKATKGYSILQGTLNMDPATRIPDLDVSIVKVENGKPTLVKTIVPADVPQP